MESYLLHKQNPKTTTPPNQEENLTFKLQVKLLLNIRIVDHSIDEIIGKIFNFGIDPRLD